MKLITILTSLAAAVSAGPQQRGPAQQKLDTTPLAFTEAQDPKSNVRFSAFGRGMSVQLARDAAFLALDQTTLPIRVVGASARTAPVAINPLPGRANFLLGNDPKRWRTDVATYAKVAYRNVLPGMDLIYYGNDKRLEYDFEVAPGGNPDRIQMEIGADWKASLGKTGTLVMRSDRNGATVEFDKPVSYQLASDGSRIAVESAYRLYGTNRFGFQTGAYDRSRTLVIDPVLVYGTYLGGSSTEEGNGIAIDGAGNAYVTGRTQSVDFPVTAGAFQTSCGAAINSPYCTNTAINRSNAYAFVTKFNPQGTQVIYSTYLGGPAVADGAEPSIGGTIGHSIAVDAAGNAYIAGQTQSLFFPVTANAAQATKAKSWRATWPGPCAPPSLVDTDPNQFWYDAFVTKLNAAGNGLLYSTYLGGTDQDSASGIAVNGAGEIFVVGSTHSARSYSLNFTGCSFDAGLYANFGYPTTTNAAYPEVIDRRQGVRLGFFTRIAANGSIAYSTYIGTGRPPTAPNDGREGHIDASKIAVDATGAAFVAGSSEDEFFGGGCALCASGGHRRDAFVIKFNSAGAIGYGPNLYGGSSHEDGNGIALDSGGNAYIAGSSAKEKPGAEFPTTVGALQTSRTNPINNVCPFVVKVSPAGATLFSTFVCGNSRDAQAYAVAVDPGTGTPVITGNSDDQLALVNNISFNAPTGNGVFLARLNTAGTNLLFSSFIGQPSGQNDNGSYGAAVVMDSQLNAFVTGSSGSATGTLATTGSYDTTPNGRTDVFVSKVSLALASDCQPNASSQMTVTRGGFRYNSTTHRWVQTVSVRNNGGSAAANAALTLDSLSSNATISGGNGVTACMAPTGSSIVNLGTIGAGQTVNVTLQFINPTNAVINYNTRVLAGTGIR